jgi:uncharacterized protein YoxC
MTETYKRLLPESEMDNYSEDADQLAREAEVMAADVFKKYTAMGYLSHEIEYIMQSAISLASCMHRLNARVNAQKE